MNLIISAGYRASASALQRLRYTGLNRTKKNTMTAPHSSIHARCQWPAELALRPPHPRCRSANSASRRRRSCFHSEISRSASWMFLRTRCSSLAMSRSFRSRNSRTDMTRLNGMPFGAGEGEGNGGKGLSSHRSDAGLVMVIWGTARTRCIGVRRENSVNAVERDVVDPSAAECGRGNVGMRFSTAELKTVSEEEDERRGDEGKSKRRSGPVMILRSLIVLESRCCKN